MGTINPTVKIGTGIALTGGGAYVMYKAFKQTTNGKKWGWGIAGTALMAGGIFTAVKGIADNSSLKKGKGQPEKKSTVTVKPAPSKYQNKQSGTTLGKPTGLTNSPIGLGLVPNPMTNQETNSNPLNNFSGENNSFANANPSNKIKIVGKLSDNDIKRMSWVKQRKEENMQKIQSLLMQLKRTPNGRNNYGRTLEIKNNIALLKAWNQAN